MSESLHKTAAGVSDSPTTNDLLNYKRFAVPIAERIASADENSTPMTIGIFGEWGMGKTSFLMMVDEALAARGITPVWFNAWKYEHEENLWSALLQTILSRAKVNGPWFRRVSVKLRIFRDSLNLRSGSWHVAKLILIFLLRLVLFLIAITLVFSWSKTDIVAFLQRYIGVLAQSHALLSVVLLKLVTGIFAVAVIKPESLWKLFSTKLSLDFSAFKKKRSYQARIAFLDDFTEEFRRIVRLIGMGKPLVVIIDDLDRCLPEKAIQVLEAIKVFLDVKGYVFLLAVDQEVIESAIAVKYKDILAAGPTGNARSAGLSTFLGENYFEKIIQLPFALPPLARDDLGRLVSHLWRDEKTKACADIFATGLPPNPRKVKRNLQTFFLLHQLAKSGVEEGIIKPSLLAKIVIIQNQFREIYRELATTPTLMEALEDYFRRGSQAGEVESDVPAPTIDPILAQRLETYAVRYPRLREIFIQETDADDTFKGAPIGDYIFFVKAVTEASITPPKIVSNEPENSIRQYFSYLVQLSKTFPVLADIEPSSRWADLNKHFVEPHLAKVSTDGDMATPIGASDLLKQSARILVFGSPGAGKTSLLKHLISMVIRETEHDTSQKPSDAPWKISRIPILLTANDLTNQESLSLKGPQDVLELLQGHFSQLNIPMAEGALQRFFEEGRCVLFVDGLDEIAEDKYSRVVDFLNILTSRYPTNQYVVSTRTRGAYGSSPLIGFDLYEILPLADKQVADFVSKALLSKEESRELVNFISSNAHLRTLSENPLFLSIIVALYSETKALPISLLGAIDQYVELSLGRWDQMRGIGGRARSVPRHLVKQALAGIALNMHEREVERIRKTDVVDLICMQISATQVEATELLYQLQSRAGLFNEVAEGIYAFVHLLLKEYLAAEAIIAKQEPISLVLKHRSDPYWRMVVQFVAGRLGDWNSEEFTRLIDRLMDGSDTESMLLAAECFLMNPMMDPDLRQRLITEMERVRTSEGLPPNVKIRARGLEKQLNGFN